MVSAESWMDKAIHLARLTNGPTTPNPKVGAIVVKNGKVVGRGRHLGPGTRHAEIVALEDAGSKARGADLYTTLEPCCHSGNGKRTPPCVPALVAAGISRVFVGTLDPNPLVRGKGVELLLQAGLDVNVGYKARECFDLNEGFFFRQLTGRPFVHVKLAQTLDGFIGPKEGSSGLLTDEQIRQKVHALRADADAVLIGAGTLRTDNPSLTVRDVIGPQPLRVILAGSAPLPAEAKLWNDRQGRVLIVHPKQNRPTFTFAQTEFCAVEADKNGYPIWNEVLDALSKENITTLLVEGGSRTAASLLNENLINRLTVITVPRFSGDGLPAIAGFSGWPPRSLSCVETSLVSNQFWLTGYLREEGVSEYWSKELQRRTCCLPAL